MKSELEQRKYNAVTVADVETDLMINNDFNFNIQCDLMSSGVLAVFPAPVPAEQCDNEEWRPEDQVGGGEH